MKGGRFGRWFGFWRRPDHPQYPVRQTGLYLGWFGRWRRFERYFIHIALGAYVRWPASSKVIERALWDTYGRSIPRGRAGA